MCLASVPFLWLQDPALRDALAGDRRWRNYFGRVTKGRILQAVSEARGDLAAESISWLKKAEMAKAAEDLLIGSGWLPEPLRTPGIQPASLADAELEAQSAGDGGELAMDEKAPPRGLGNVRAASKAARARSACC